MTLPLMKADDEELITLDEAKLWLRIDHDHEDNLIRFLIESARQYLRDATGREWSRANTTARLAMLALIADAYENRELTVGRNSTKDLRPAIQSIIAQLQYAPPPGESESGEER